MLQKTPPSQKIQKFRRYAEIYYLLTRSIKSRLPMNVIGHVYGKLTPDEYVKIINSYFLMSLIPLLHTFHHFDFPFSRRLRQLYEFQIPIMTKIYSSFVLTRSENGKKIIPMYSQNEQGQWQVATYIKKEGKRKEKK